ncbi:MAG: SCP2 sterol-binding domain-containing protein [Actinomycetota bacterium]|nr:SCP2 sterol-binding domain-containing protein [Actinomycetota bacterium]
MPAGKETMHKYLSQEWLDAGRELAQEFPERPGATARLQYQVVGTPSGDVHYYWVVENGNLQESTLGDDPDAEITLSMSYDDAVKMQKGELDANAAFMQGRIKVVPGSNMGKLMSLLPLTQSPEYKAIQSKINDITIY